VHANVRQYRISPDRIDETMHLADEHLADRLADEPGFVAYELVASEDGSICSMTIFDGRAGAERSQQMAADFVRDHLSGVEIERTSALTGEVMVSRAREGILEAAHH
jgi:hypothetical protein